MHLAGSTGWKPGMVFAIGRQQRPSAVASAMPSRKPWGEVSGVLMSPCWSNQMIESAASPATAPQVVRQLPDSTTGKRPSSRLSPTFFATALQTAKPVAISRSCESLDLADLFDVDVMPVERQRLDESAGDQRIRALAEACRRGARCHRAQG